MTKIIKYYIDIGCVYEGDNSIKNSYKDFQNWNTKKYGLMGVLKLRIDSTKKTKEEIFFKQVFSPYVDQFAKHLITDIVCDKNRKEECKDILMIFREYRDADLVITWNGRDFDLPIIINNINFSKEYGQHCLDCISKKDRDLLDLCILREINVKGGLQEVVKRLHIDSELDDKHIPVYHDNEMCFLTEFDAYTNKYNNYIKLVRHRNEFDVRILPLLEDKLGYLYESRIIQDKFHKKW